MSAAPVVVLEVTRIEAVHLAGLVTQFAELLDGATSSAGDPAIARLVPDAYADDAPAAQDFRSLTERDLLDRRRSDAQTVLSTLKRLGVTAEQAVGVDEVRTMEVQELHLEPEELQAWLRCLAAVRLVLATRLGIQGEQDHDADDPRFGVYEWLGYRLEGLVRAASDHT